METGFQEKWGRGGRVPAGPHPPKKGSLTRSHPPQKRRECEAPSEHRWPHNRQTTSHWGHQKRPSRTQPTHAQPSPQKKPGVRGSVRAPLVCQPKSTAPLGHPTTTHGEAYCPSSHRLRIPIRRHVERGRKSLIGPSERGSTPGTQRCSDGASHSRVKKRGHSGFRSVPFSRKTRMTSFLGVPFGSRLELDLVLRHHLPANLG